HFLHNGHCCLFGIRQRIIGLQRQRFSIPYRHGDTTLQEAPHMWQDTLCPHDSHRDHYWSCGIDELAHRTLASLQATIGTACPFWKEHHLFCPHVRHHPAHGVPIMLPTPHRKRPEGGEHTAQEAGAEQFRFRRCPDNLQSLCSNDRVGN